MAKPSIQQLIDAGVEFTRGRASRPSTFVKQLVKAGEVQTQDAETIVQQLVDRGRETTERISTT